MMKIKNIFLLCLLFFAVNCSEYFAFKIIGRISKYQENGNYSVIIRLTNGQKVKNAKIKIVNADTVLITFGALNGIPNTLAILENDSLISKADFDFDRKSRKGYIMSNLTNHNIEFKKSKDTYGDKLYVAEGVIF